MTQTTIPAPSVLTDAQRKKKERDLAMLGELNELMKAKPGRARTPVIRYLMAKYDLSSLSGFYSAVLRTVEDPDTPKELVSDYQKYYQYKK